MTSCADCGSPAGDWVSLNKCVVLCSECASVHRSLGSHISYVKPIMLLKHSPQFKLVEAICKSSGNSVWEENISKSMSRGQKKPTKDDKITSKSEFIRAKYSGMHFVKRSEDVLSPSELSKTLQAAVKAPHLESTLRCIIMGANVNMKNGMTGMAPLHFAAQAGMEVQVELLVLNGADVCATDFEDRLPEQVAKEHRKVGLAARLTELRFQVTDKLTHFISAQRPKHAKGEHLLIPRLKESSCDSTHLMKNAIDKLQSLTDEQFCDLVSDLFDEVERREIDGYLVSSSSDPFEQPNINIVPFLPLNPSFSSTRNQSRQKLARFNSRELNTFIRDVLIETRRRQMRLQPEQIDLTTGELLYQEDDYEEPSAFTQNMSPSSMNKSGPRRHSMSHQNSKPSDEFVPVENHSHGNRRPSSKVYNANTFNLESPNQDVNQDPSARFSRAMGNNMSAHTSGSSPRPMPTAFESMDSPGSGSVNVDNHFGETMRLALDRIKVLETTNRDLEERIKTQERMILELVERNHFLTKSQLQCECGKGAAGSNNAHSMNSNSTTRPASAAATSSSHGVSPFNNSEGLRKTSFSPSAAPIQEYIGHEYSVPSTYLHDYDVVNHGNASPKKGGNDSGFNDMRSSEEDTNLIVSVADDVKKRAPECSVIESSGEMSIDEKCTRFTPPSFATPSNEEFDASKPPELPPKGIPALPNMHNSGSMEESASTKSNSRTSGESNQSQSSNSSTCLTTTATSSNQQLKSKPTIPNLNPAHPSTGASTSADVDIALVRQKTEQLTKKIKVMWQACQEQRHDCFVSCSDNIRALVTEFISIFSQSYLETHGSSIKSPLELMESSSYRLQIECKSAFDELEPYTDQELIVTVINQIFICCVDIAHGIKAVVQFLQIE